MNSATIVQKLWNYCNVLRDDGMSYGDYVEQLTYLLFLKMADERSQPPYSQRSMIPKDYAWPTPLVKDGDELFEHYRHTLEEPAISSYWPVYRKPGRSEFDEKLPCTRLITCSLSQALPIPLEAMPPLSA